MKISSKQYLGSLRKYIFDSLHYTFTENASKASDHYV